MKRRHILFNLLAAISLLLCAAISVLWARSYWVRDDVTWVEYGDRPHTARIGYLSSHGVSASGGGLAFSRRLLTNNDPRLKTLPNALPTEPQIHWTKLPSTGYPSGEPGSAQARWWTIGGFGRFMRWRTSGLMGDYWDVIILPYWCLFLASALLPVLVSRRRYRAWRQGWAIRDVPSSPAVASIGAPLATGANSPDWKTSKEELLCPLCEYNLHGISEPRCPECGYRFSWNELLTAKQNQHPYLFEEQNRRRLSAFWKTATGGFSPGKFWRELKPTQRPRPLRIWFYFAVVMALCLMGEIVISLAANSQGFSFSGLRRRDFEAGSMCVFATLYWPFATIAALMIFRVSMNRVRLRPIHALRCVLYSADCIIWLGLFLIGCTGPFILIGDTSYAILLPAVADFLPLMAVCFLFLFVYRLCRAYQLYMRFDWPIATVLASQAIVLLGLCVIVTYWNYRPW